MNFLDACTAKYAPATLMDLTDDEYFSMEGKLLSAHTIIRYARDPVAFWVDEPKATSDAMTFGTAVHLLLLEGREAFDREFMVYEGSDAFHEASGRFVGRGSNRWQEILNGVGHNGRYVLHRKEADRLFGMQVSFSRYRDMLEGCMFETTAFWSMHNMRWRAKIDAMSPRGGLVVDLKTTSDLNRVDESIDKYGYGLQAAVYSSCFRELYGAFPTYKWIFIEKSEPYDCLVKEYDGLDLWTDLNALEELSVRFRQDVLERSEA